MREEPWDCQICRSRFLISRNSLLRHNGISGSCLACGTAAARVHCVNCTPHEETWWLPVIADIVSRTCPWCGAVMRVGEEILAWNVSEQVKQLARAAIVIAGLFGLASLIDYGLRSKAA
jgi:hypothetical protein